MKTGRRVGFVLAALLWAALGRAGWAQDNRIVIGETLKLRSAVLDEDRAVPGPGHP